MKNIAWFCGIVQLCFVLGNASGAGRVVTVRNCGRSFDEDRMKGGTPVREGLYPWMVALHWQSGRKFLHKCAGYILNERWIVTAAHCLLEYPNKPEKYGIFVGVNHASWENLNRAARHKISKIIRHEGYNKDYGVNDIALLKTVDPIDFGGSEGFVNGICLPAMNQEFQQSRAMVAGWQSVAKYHGVVTLTHHEDLVPIIKPENCASMRSHVTRNMICAGSAKLYPWQWYTNSGESLILWPVGRAVLVGIVSYGTTYVRKGAPGIYTKVSSYVNWIENHINAD